MVADARQGNRAVIRVAAPAGARRNEIEDRIREEMKYFATPYEIIWAGSDVERSPT